MGVRHKFREKSHVDSDSADVVSSSSVLVITTHQQPAEIEHNIPYIAYRMIQ